MIRSTFGQTNSGFTPSQHIDFSKPPAHKPSSLGQEEQSTRNIQGLSSKKKLSKVDEEPKKI